MLYIVRVVTAAVASILWGEATILNSKGSYVDAGTCVATAMFLILTLFNHRNDT